MNALAFPLKFCAGATSNLVGQAVRAAINCAVSLAAAAAGACLFLLCLLQFAGGGKKAGGESASRAWRLAERSVCSGLSSMIQAAAAVTLVSPLLRGAQACDETFAPRGVCLPIGSGRNRIQKILGLNSWRPDGDKVEKGRSQKEISRELPPRGPQTEDWDLVVANYLAARNAREMDSARRDMALKHPMRYIKALKAARSASRRRNKA